VGKLAKLSAVLGMLCFAALAYSYTYQIKTTAVQINTTATKLPTTALVGREYIQLQNVGNVTAYIGASTVANNTTVGSTGGTQLMPYSTWYQEYDDSVVVYGRTASGNCTIITEEGK